MSIDPTDYQRLLADLEDVVRESSVPMWVRELVGDAHKMLVDMGQGPVDFKA